MLICSGRVQLAVSDFREKLAWREATAWQPSLPPAAAHLWAAIGATCVSQPPPPPPPHYYQDRFLGPFQDPNFRFSFLAPHKRYGYKPKLAVCSSEVLTLTLIHLQ